MVRGGMGLKKECRYREYQRWGWGAGRGPEGLSRSSYPGDVFYDPQWRFGMSPWLKKAFNVQLVYI